MQSIVSSTLKSSVYLRGLSMVLLCSVLGCTSIIDTPSENASDSTSVSNQIIPTDDQGTWFMVDGKPFFPIAVWAQPHWEVANLKQLGINTIYNNGLGSPEDSNVQLLDTLAAHDMYAFLGFHDPLHPDFNSVRNHPSLLAWTFGDEPDLYGTPVATLVAEHDRIRAHDPIRPTLMNLTGGFYWDTNYGNSNNEALYHQYTDIAEMISFDHYPVSGWNRHEFLYQPGIMTKTMLDRYVNRQKLVGAIIETCDQRLSWVPPETPSPTPQQMRFQIWDAIINGAQMIGYFTIAFDPFVWSNVTPENEAELIRSNDQIKRLTNVILSSDRTQELNVQISEANQRPLNYTVRKNGNNYYLFVSNASMATSPNSYPPAQATFQFANPPQFIEVFDESRTITANGNRFTDNFTGLGVHIYRIRF